MAGFISFQPLIYGVSVETRVVKQMGVPLGIELFSGQCFSIIAGEAKLMPQDMEPLATKLGCVQTTYLYFLNALAEAGGCRTVA